MEADFSTQQISHGNDSHYYFFHLTNMSYTSRVTSCRMHIIAIGL